MGFQLEFQQKKLRLQKFLFTEVLGYCVALMQALWAQELSSAQQREVNVNVFYTDANFECPFSRMNPFTCCPSKWLCCYFFVKMNLALLHCFSRFSEGLFTNAATKRIVQKLLKFNFDPIGLIIMNIMGNAERLNALHHPHGTRHVRTCQTKVGSWWCCSLLLQRFHLIHLDVEFNSEV